MDLLLGLIFLIFLYYMIKSYQKDIEYYQEKYFKEMDYNHQLIKQIDKLLANKAIHKVGCRKKMKTIKEARELLLLDIREDMEELMNSLIPPYSRVEGGGKNPYLQGIET